MYSVLEDRVCFYGAVDLYRQVYLQMYMKSDECFTCSTSPGVYRPRTLSLPATGNIEGNMVYLLGPELYGDVRDRLLVIISVLLE
jgi:hypothetical protein